MMRGFFDLRDSGDLFQKLQADFARLQRDPTDSYAAFDFCVTAWHLVEWHFPKESRAAFCADNPILTVCENLAVGAKHFAPRDPRLTAVATTGNTSVWVPRTWAIGVWKPGTWAGDLIVHLDGSARETFGETITIQDLAERIMEIWRECFSS